ncbi:MAG: site-specific integrase [Actinomycetota bacterium]|nr:site-specific integrase [Actinomycetota bacterium]
MAPSKVVLSNGDERWEVRYRDSGRDSSRRKRRFIRKGDAELFETEIKRRRQLGDLAGSQWSRRTVGDLAADWFDLYVVPNLAKRTRRDYQVLLDRHVIPRLGRLKLRDVSTDVIDRFKRDLERQGTGRSQTRQALAVLQGMFRYAEERGRIARNPVRLVRKPSNKRDRAVNVLAPEKVERVRDQLLAEDRLGDATLVSVLAYLGLRPQEALALEWSHVRERTVLIDQKNVDGELIAGQKTGRRARSPALIGPLRSDLMAWRLRSGNPASSLVFPNYNNEPWRQHDWLNWNRRIWTPVARRLGIQDPPYTLRHSYASLRMREGVSIPELADDLGHSPIMTLDTYSHVMRELKGAPTLSAEEQVRKARSQRSERSAG